MLSEIKVLLVDDHQIVIDGIHALLEDLEDIVVVGKCSNGKMALDFLESNPIDLILMDIDMPVMSGIEVTKLITKKFPKVKVVALSMHNKLSYVKRMLQNGAQGYLLKTTNKAELLTAIKTVVSKQEQFISPSLKKEILNDIFNQDSKSNRSIPIITKREKQVLQLISEEFTNVEIAKQLFISVNTVEFHRKNLLNKFDVRNSVGLVKTALQLGVLN